MEGLAQYLHNNIGSTGVYIGQLEPPLLKVADDAEENAHLDKNADEVVKFKYANSDHKDLVVGTVIKAGKGLCHNVFTEDMTNKNQKIDTEKPIEKQFKHIYVPEVIREPKMHYWTVPRLGSYMAVPLVYKSCLSITAFDKSVTDYKVWQDAVKA